MTVPRLCLLALSMLFVAPLARAQRSPAELRADPPRRIDVRPHAPLPPIERQLADGAELERGSAPAPAAERTVRAAATRLGARVANVLFDEPGDGRIWAMGDTYKASFGAEGATYIPFFGSRAPQSFPVAFAVASIRAGGEMLALDGAAAPVRSGERVVFDRGAALEAYDLSPRSVEQSFVFEGPLAGEIVIEIAVASELSRASDCDGLVLAGEHGSVRYGRAFALDAAGGKGGKTELESEWAGDTIRITIPAERVAAASWPLVVDPVLFTFDVDDEGAYADSYPDLAYDASTGWWMVAYERAISSGDHDIVYRILTSNGVEITTGSIDITIAYWAKPKVANNNKDDTFLCVAEQGFPDSGTRYVRGRVRPATGFPGPQFTINALGTGDNFNPNVGGDPLTPLTDTYFCVVWERTASATDHNIHARLVDTSGSLFGDVIYLSTSFATIDHSPAVSKTCGLLAPAPQNWNVVWARDVAAFDNDLWGAQIGPTGTVTTPPFPIDESSANTGAPDVSTSVYNSSRNYMVVAMRQTSAFGDFNTWGWVLSGTTLVDSGNLTAMAGGSTGPDQWYPSVDCDGSLFVVADNEATSGSDQDVHVSTFHVLGTVLTLAEGHQLLAGTATHEHYAEVACAASSGGPPRITMIAWQNDTASYVGDIEAGAYEASPFAQYCDPGLDGVIACPCGNAPSSANRGCNNSAGTGGAVLTASGNIVLDNVVLSASLMLPNALCIFSQGNALVPAGTAFGDGVRCVGGQLLRLATKTASGGAAHFPTSSDPSITQRAAALGQPINPGSNRFYYTYYRDPGAYACASTFSATNAVRIQW